MNWKKIFYWLLVIFTVYITFELIRHILGGSLGSNELIAGLLIANLGYTFHNSSRISEHIGWHRGKGSLSS